jgi:DNA ligase-1
LRKNTNYKGKRSNDLLKVKEMHDAEYIVTDIETGPMRIIESGIEITDTVLTNVIINHKGFEVSVGSGFKLAERQHYYEHPEDIVGKTITVRYFEETKNQQGGLSLRFPIVKYVHNNPDLVMKM